MLPYFDYCSTLFAYFPKSTLQRLLNGYNFCLIKLLKVSPDSAESSNEFNNRLEKFGLNNFQHRIIIRLATFIHKIVNSKGSPEQLKDQLKLNKNIEKISTNSKQKSKVESKKHFLRNGNEMGLPNGFKLYNHYGEVTFAHIFCKLINSLFLADLALKFSFFKTVVFNNINLLYDKLIKCIPKFNLLYKT